MLRILQKRKKEKVNLNKLTRCRIQFMTLNESRDTLCVEGVFPLLEKKASSVRLEVLCNGEKYAAHIYPRKHGPQLHFRTFIPVSESMQLIPRITVDGLGTAEHNFTFGKFAMLDENYPNTSYCIRDGVMFSLLDGVLYIKTNIPEENSNDEMEHLHQTELLKSEDGAKWVELRKKVLANKKNKTKELWLFCDRMTSAEDSAEEFFKYVNSRKNSNIETVFIIREDCPDYERLQQFGRVIPFKSFEHYEAFLMADKVISSAADEYVINPFEKANRFVRDLCEADFIFPQHGVIKDDLSGWLHRGNKNIRLFVTSSDKEKEAIIKDPYGYTDREVILTGIPRFDTLSRDNGIKQEKVIYIMPTWRKWIAPDFDISADSVDNIEVCNENFKDTDYYKFYNNLLKDGHLHELIEKYDYEVYFALHPRMGAEMKTFYSSDRIHLLKPESFSYSDAAKRMCMLVTDYSSVAFNIAFLRKPIVYAQFDFEEFYKSGKHTSIAGYFDFEKDGFGPVVKTVDEVVNEIEKNIISEMKMCDKYKLRADDFFFDPPEGKNRCDLLYERILQL